MVHEKIARMSGCCHAKASRNSPFEHNPAEPPGVLKAEEKIKKDLVGRK